MLYAMNPVIITNNKIVLNESKLKCIAVDGDADEVLLKVRDFIHSGSVLLSYPLGGSIKMLHSPVLSVIIDKALGVEDLDSIDAIETSILKLRTTMGERAFDYRNIDDYEIIDFDRLKAAMRELKIEK